LARKILLADDSVTAQNMGRKILADAGYEVIAVNNGSAALKKIAELKPDLVILDVYMPGYSGLEVCQRMKESQESSRIPVLLSVGKLEPFKPEEAQRVRADGYIVKPFEASELLSALSKLEDKVVPRAEPSKPGRFARAVAAAEESARGSEKTSEQSGWKSRIGFPREKTEAAEKVADEASIYNPMNRDLRTVVQTTEQKASETSADEKWGRQEAANANVDVAALAASGLPKDVTAEEVVAIAAAAAQIQMAESAARQDFDKQDFDKQAFDKDEQRASELPTGQVRIESRAGAAAPAEEVQSQSAGVEQRDQQTAQPLEQQRTEQQQDEPVTMAATADSMGTSRWTAVPVALEGEEATLSLEHEMQKVYAAIESEPTGVTRVEAEAAGAVNSPAAVPEVESAVEAVSDGGPVEIERVNSVEAAQAEPGPVAQVEAAVLSEATVPSGVNDDVPSSPVYAESSPTPGFAESDKAMPVAEFLSPVSEAEVAGLAGLVGLSAESQLAAEPEAVSAPATTTSKPFMRIEREPGKGAEPVEEPKPEQEDVKSAAAAWSSWRQIRDTSNGGEAGPAQAEPEESQSARAVAAGAEQMAQAVESNKSPADVASIVDSVLADLRPKLMAEISRKMAEKK
jgi:CheY-like chemotaxis protein